MSELKDLRTEDRLKTLWDGIVPGEGAEARIREQMDRVRSEPQKPVWMRIPAAACLIAAFGMSAILLAGRIRMQPPVYTYTTEEGAVLTFQPAKTVAAASIHFDYPVVVRPLTAEESEGLFGRVSASSGGGLLANDDLVWRGGNSGGDLSGAPDFSGGIANDDLVWRQADPDSYVVVQPEGEGQSVPYHGQGDGVPGNPHAVSAPIITVPAGESSSGTSIWGTFREDSGELIRVEGTMNGTKIAAAAPGIPVTDTVVGDGGDSGIERIDGVDVALSSFTTDPNSRGERTVVLDASFSVTVTDVKNGGAAEWRFEAVESGPVGEADAAAKSLIESVRRILAAGHTAVRYESAQTESGEGEE